MEAQLEAQLGAQLGAVEVEASAPATAARLIYPGFAAFRVPGELPAIPPELRKPLFRRGWLEPGYFLLHFRGGTTPADERRLEELVHDSIRESIRESIRPPVPGGALLLWIEDPSLWLALRRYGRTDWLDRYQPAYKVDPALVVDEAASAPLALTLELIPGRPVAPLVRALEDLGVRVLESAPIGGALQLAVEAPPRTWIQIAHLEGIYRLEARDETGPLPSAGHTRSTGGGGSREKSVVPITLTLRVTAGLNSKNGPLSAADLALLRTGDNNRLNLRDREELTLAFDQTVPADAIVSAVRVFVEHLEQPRVHSGDVLWEFGRGSIANPIVAGATPAPLRSQETLDAWSPATLVPNLNDLKVLIDNGNLNDATVLDQVYVEVDYLLPDLTPHVTSTPNSAGFLGEAYAYDADSRAEASGATPLAWSLVSGPAGFTIQASTGLITWTPSATGSFPVAIRVANARGAETQPFTITVSERPFPSTLLPVNPTPLDYCPPERRAFGPAKSQQHLNVFLPRGTPPPNGWPVVLNNRAGGGIPAAPLASLSDTGGTAALHAFVASGVAVVDFGATGIGSGEGLFYPPGHPSGRYESFRAADDNPEKEAEWATQWLKVQSSFPLDTGEICLRGSSHGAIISIWSAMGPERARATGSAQVRASTRVKAVLALQPPTSVWAFDQGADLAVRMVAHFEQAALPGVPATAFGQVTEDLQKDASVMRFAFDSAESRTHNEGQAICLLYSEPVMHIGSAPADLSLNAEGYPRLHDVLRQPFIHDSWAGYVLYKRLLDLSPRSAIFHHLNSVFAVRDTTALPPPFDYHTQTFSGGVTGNGARAVAHEWVLRTLGVTPEPVDTGSGFSSLR